MTTATPSRSRFRARTGEAAATGGESRFYDLVALALGRYVRARFRVRVLGAPLELRHPSLVVSSHRSDDDVPLLVAALYRAAHGPLRRGPAVHFVVRDDLFEPGFFAGYPRGVPRRLRRLLWPVGVGPVLRRHLPCHPAAWPNAARLVQLLRAHPDVPLEELLSMPLLDPLQTRGDVLGRLPRLARDVLDGDFADLLWPVVERAELNETVADEWWSRRHLQ
ncbi:MAG TPA: hypothetical protein VE088_02995, partial [Gaiellaceae bacterium]|nr:hypothetical protein [Gaiellaceae bacterium]